ncbi:MFS domain-containing protein [Mycena indigotica]|uniref:MFS domain-containing protein n=1 Tax=Mycena indigotica TaxID=2126181 RepID=A0A8H6WEN4_9AGAR|nr:MFS domain-containing protein [Mycena indigotica]KAF7315002.1 MFS domain-containing protein [Mycena indigotica]
MEKVPSRTSTDPEKNVDSSGVSVSSADQTVNNPALEAKDRTNIGNAKVAGLTKDLKMTPKQYSIALTVTYVPYIAAELPSNLLLKKIGPNLMLPTMITLWGIVTACQGTVKSYGGLLACRFFLGLLEGGVFPGLVLYLSFFYPRMRLQTRIAAFFSAASISGAFGGILAYGIIHLNGKAGHTGWQWIFIIEGAITSFIGLVSYGFMPASPDHARFLNAEEKAYVKAKLEEDGAINDADSHFSWGEVIKGFTSIHVLLVGVNFFFSGVVLYSLAYFVPPLIQSLGYTAARAQLMSVPPFSVAFVLTMISAYISDRYQSRGWITVFCAVLCVAGFGTWLGSTDHHVQYGSLFLSVPGVYLGAPALSTWNANNSAPHTRRAAAIAFGFIMTNAGGILATWLLGSLSAPPRYIKATQILLAFSVLIGAFAIFNIIYLSHQNKLKAEKRKTMSKSEEEPGLGDKSAWFVYSL